MSNEGFQPVGSRLRAIRKRDRENDLEPPSFSLGIGEASEMPSFDLGLDSDAEPDGLGGLPLRVSEGLQRPAATQDRGSGGLGGARKGAAGEAGSGLERGVKTQCSEKPHSGEERPRGREPMAQPLGRFPVAEGRLSTPDDLLPDAAAKARNRLRKVSSGATEREAPGFKLPAPSPLGKAADVVARSPDEMAAGAFADSDEEDRALLSIDFRSAGKSRASDALTPIRKRGLEAGQGLGVGGWRTPKGAASESLDRVGVNRAEAAQIPREAELRAAEDHATKHGFKPKQSDTEPDPVNTELAPGPGKEYLGAQRCQGVAGVPLDGLRTPLPGIMQKQDRREKDLLRERKSVGLRKESEGLEGFVNQSSGLDSQGGLKEISEGREARREEKTFDGRDFVPDSEDDEIEDVSSPEAKKVPAGAVSGKRRVTLGSAHLRQDRPPANHTTPRGHPVSSSIAVESRVVQRTQLHGEKRGPVSEQAQNLDGNEPGMDKRPGDGEVLGGKSAKKPSGKATGGVASDRKSSLVSGLRKRKSDENGGGWSEWPANAFGCLEADGSGRNGKENGTGTDDGSRYRNRNGTRTGPGVCDKVSMGAGRPVPPDLGDGRNGGLADNPAAKSKGFSPNRIANEAKRGKRWSGFGAAEDTSAGFGGFGTASERTYPSFGAVGGGLGTGSDRTYPPFGATAASANPGAEAETERSYPAFGPGLGRASPEGPSLEECEGFGGDSQSLGGSGEGFEGFGGVSRGAGGDERAGGFWGLRRPWSPPPPDFGSMEDEGWEEGATEMRVGSRAERDAEWGGGTEAGNGVERANGMGTACGSGAAENGTDWERTSWGEDMEANGIGPDGTRQGGPGAYGSGASGTGAAEQEAVTRLLRERLPHYKPLDMLMREGGFDNEPIFIDYRNQFADIPSGGGGSSRSFGGKKAGGGRRPAAKPSGPIHTGGAQEMGHWTTIAGKKVYVNKTGKTLEGRAAYRSHLKDSGAQPKKKRRKARKKGASKKR